ncbi:MAG: SprT-like domain-containing protein [Acidobacteriaceae bacterium]|nr:SprT-like domain-containing protein [Acidobacteriaceae bacterium]
MQVETALFFESVEQIYARVFRLLKPRTPVPRITIRFRRYANANSRIRLADGHLAVDISDLLESAPAPIQEALAHILIGKLYRKAPDTTALARYRRYLNRSDMRHSLQHAKQSRGRKHLRDSKGEHYDLREIFEELNFRYFHGLMAMPQLGWSVKPSRTTLGHYDPSHHVIVLSSILDSPSAPEPVVRFVMFHEMLHLRFPTEHRGPRRCVHTREFKKAEREFENYHEATRQLRHFLQAEIPKK